MTFDAILKAAVQYLVTANTALPVIVTTIDTIAATVKAVTGEGPSVKERAEIIRAVVADNERYLDADIARLEQIVAEQDAARGFAVEDLRLKPANDTSD